LIVVPSNHIAKRQMCLYERVLFEQTASAMAAWKQKSPMDCSMRFYRN